MAPAFSSSRQALAFAIALSVILLLPALFPKKCLPPRATVYSATPDFYGPFAYHYHQIYEEKSEVDMVFLGSSRMWFGIDTPHVQTEFSNFLGRKSVVFTLSWLWDGQDLTYFLLKDLLEHRKVKVVVVAEESAHFFPHGGASRWFRVGDNWQDLDGLSVVEKTAYYVEAMRGMSRQLLEYVRPDIPGAERLGTREIFYHAPSSATRFGSMAARLEDSGNPDFVEVLPAHAPAPALIYSEETKASFEFSPEPYSREQLYFAKKTADLAAAHGARLVWLHIPTRDEANSPRVMAKADWSKILNAPSTLVGIPGTALFGGLTDDEMLKLYVEKIHLNANGQRYFTESVTPTLLKIYDETTHR